MAADQVDVLVVTALRDEMEAVKAAASVRWPRWSGVPQWQPRDVGRPAPYWWGQIQTTDGQGLSIALARPSGMGGRLTASFTTSLVERLQPSCLAMCGICAGNPAATALGDVVIADLAYEWDEGKHSATGFEADHRQMPLNPRWRWSVEEFDPSVLPSFGEASEDESMWWLLERLTQGQDPRDHPARRRYFPTGTWAPRLGLFEASGKIARGPDGTVHLTETGTSLVQRRVYDDVDGPRRLPLSVVAGPMASGSAVVGDGDVWSRLRQMGVRRITAVDMEAATIATIAHDRGLPWLVVKGVSGHAGVGKDDRYRNFAARASAEVLFTLLTELLPDATGTASPLADEMAAEADRPKPTEPAGYAAPSTLRSAVEDGASGGDLSVSRSRPIALDPWVMRLLKAQEEDAYRHRYRFYGGHAPALPRLYVEQRGELPLSKAQVNASGVLTVAEMLSQFNDVLVVSDPGMGKSTMIALIQHEQARWWQRAPTVDPPPYGRVIPIALPATMLVGRTLEQAVNEVCRRLGAEHEIGDLGEALPVPNAAWLVMIDGLDEVLEADNRSSVLTKIAYWIGQADPRRRFVVTSRPLMFSELAELRRQRVGEFALRSFEDADVATFARNWFVATCPDDAVDGLVAAFLSRVSTARLRTVIRIPLLATIAALFFDRNRERPLPSGRTELYGWFVTHLVHGRPESKEQRQLIREEFAGHGDDARVDGDWLSQSTEKLLEHLAAGYLDRDPEPLVARAERWVRSATSDVGLISVPGWEGHLRALLTSTAALVERGHDLEFAYHSVAEYLAAGPRADNFDEQQWFADIRNPSRRHFAMFVLARSAREVEPIVQTLLASGGSDVVAAGDIVADGLIGVSVPVAQHVVQALFAQLEAEDPDAPEAARVLVELSGDPDIATGLEALVDGSARSWVRAYVADALDEVGTATPRLQRIATHPDLPTDVRSWAIHRIKRREPELAAVLVRDLGGIPTAQTQPAKASVLAQHVYRREIADSPDSTTRLTFALHLVESGDRIGLDALRECVLDADLRIDLRFQAARSCRDSDREGSAFLHTVVADDDHEPESRTAAALALAEKDSRKGIQFILQMVDSEPELVARLPAIRTVLDLLEHGASLTHSAVHSDGAIIGGPLSIDIAERSPQVWDVPSRNPNFTGRRELLTRLREKLQLGRAASVLPRPVLGLGGVGKSQLAIEFAHRHSNDFDLVWWVPSAQPSLVLSSLTRLADRLNLGAGPEANAAVPAVLEALSTRHTRWLLIFDNAEHPAEIHPYFPPGGTGTILVTSRNTEWATVTRSLEVDVFNRAESVQFLRTRTPDLTDDDAARLAHALDDLPLALDQAAAWQAATGMSTKDYLELLNHKGIEPLADPMRNDHPVTAAWNISLDRLARTNPGALHLLQVCSFLAPERIPRELFSGAPIASITTELDATLSDAVRLARAIRDIQRYSLAQVDHRTNTLQLHQLVQTVLVDRMSREERDTMRRGAHTLLAGGDPTSRPAVVDGSVTRPSYHTSKHRAPLNPTTHGYKISSSGWSNSCITGVIMRGANDSPWMPTDSASSTSGSRIGRLSDWRNISATSSGYSASTLSLKHSRCALSTYTCRSLARRTREPSTP